MMLRMAIVALVVMLLPSSGWAQKRVALVVGNAAYQHAGMLANPLNDARDVAAALTQLGFQVILGTNLDKRAFDVKVKEFARALDRADVGLFFYAGHGLQVTGVNYLAATDAKLEAERDLDFETVKVEFVLAQMEREAKTNIVFLDACRNNPLARNLARTMGTRGVNEKSGLAPIKSGLGTFIAFATQPGNVAGDGAGGNSPFTTALKKHITAPGVSLTDVMIEVRNDVVGTTNGAQVPWEHSALRGRFYFNEVVAPPPATPAASSLSGTMRRLSAEEITAVFSSKATQKGFDQRSRCTFTITFSADGTMAGRNNAGTAGCESQHPTDTGTWFAKGDVLCLKWSKWGWGKQGCSGVVLTGPGTYERLLACCKNVVRSSYIVK